MSVDHIARSDCEQVRGGFIGQPVNTASSLAYCAAGAWIWRRGATAPWRAVAVAAVTVGVGSAAYHGPGGRLGHLVHDASNVVLVATVTAATARTRCSRPALARAAAVTSVIGVAVHYTSRSGRALCRPDSVLQGHALWHLLGAGAVATMAEAHRPDTV